MLSDERVIFLTKTNKNLSTDKKTNKEKNTTINKNNISQLEYPNTTKTTDPNVGQSHIINTINKQRTGYESNNQYTKEKESNSSESSHHIESEIEPQVASNDNDSSEKPEDNFIFPRNRRNTRKNAKNKNIGSADDNDEEFTGEKP
ncbi:hypothetical protein JTB14_035938 [Gonioctena quinquepunctata]|nr:hypothetical protein JTB14_035938 [Gonioctena quinquepunctata]